MSITVHDGLDKQCEQFFRNIAEAKLFFDPYIKNMNNHKHALAKEF